MNLDDSNASGTGAPLVKPLLRTVLLCDIVESTALVERIGDMRAALLLQKHDQLLRQTIAFCHGQLIDKADGVLALFERPIQALDFALRYLRGLRDLGQAENMPLKARIGMHVGDVMMWANEPRDVKNGAKPFEVEGLAKPVAARLMNLALPGQVLMSGMAQNLCQRAVGELGDAGKNLRFLLHGRYRFKGVPAPMLVHEVGEPGLSPLRAPESGAKAWRELPLWRRPPVVALEVLLIAVLAVGGLWTTFRAPPAIAFAERDWVVVADLQNRTSEPMFDDALDAALRIGLEQSRHINLISELQIDRALERMQRPDQPVDRQLATELALREGARAVILPTVAEVGGITRVSLEVIDPNSGVTVFSESADAANSGAVLAALDSTTNRVRGHLGEAIGSIEATSLPMEQVTTGSLEALRAYSMAQKARYENRPNDALPLYLEAVRLDPQFAMAYLRLAFLRYIENDADGAREWIAKASAHRDHLSQREALFLDGAGATLDNPDVALVKFRMLGSLYPDEYRAAYNFAYFAHFDLLRSEEGLEAIGPALSTRNPAHADAAYLAGVLALASNRYDEALTYFSKSESLGGQSFKRERVHAWLAQRRPTEAARVLSQESRAGVAAQQLQARLLEIELPLDSGRWSEAVDAARRLEKDAAAEEANELTLRSLQLSTLSLRSYAPDPGFAADLRSWSKPLESDLASADDLLRRHLLFQAYAGAWMAAYTGDAELADSLLQLAPDDPLVAAFPANAAMRRIGEAEVAIQSGRAADVEAILAQDMPERAGLYFSRAVMMRARIAIGDVAGAAELADWLSANRGRAFAEANSLGAWQQANIIESTLALYTGAALAAAAGDTVGEERNTQAFAAAWPDGGDPGILEGRANVR